LERSHGPPSCMGEGRSIALASLGPSSSPPLCAPPPPEIQVPPLSSHEYYVLDDNSKAELYAAFGGSKAASLTGQHLVPQKTDLLTAACIDTHWVRTRYAVTARTFQMLRHALTGIRCTAVTGAYT